MKEHPILFSAPMVRAILAGQKTQTRRVLKQATGPSLSVGMADEAQGVAELSWLHGDGPGYDVEETIRQVACPYGQPRDRLWVREAWRASLAFELTPPRDIPAGTPLRYTADGSGALPPENAGKYRPPMFMPRWASRITLEVTGVRVERLQDISDDDAIAEGLTCQNGLYATPGEVWQIDPRKAYRDLWEQLNGPGSWDANPWVWVVEFRRLP